MKFILGFLAGLATGAYLFDNMTEAQRARVNEATSSAVQRVRQTRVVSSVGDNVSAVAGAASDRIAGVVDSTGDKLTGVVEKDDTTVAGSAVAS